MVYLCNDGVILILPKHMSHPIATIANNINNNNTIIATIANTAAAWKRNPGSLLAKTWV